MKKLLTLLLLTGLLSCEKQDIESLDCDLFITGLNTMDENILKSEIEKLTVDLSPHPSDEDRIGHSGNLQTLIDRLNAGCDGYSVSLICYACIETYPAQSEILVDFFVGGSKQTITIDIHTPENDILRFAGIHQ
jgi:hypothetical protein